MKSNDWRKSELQQPKTVAIWNYSWLPASETFVRDHVESLKSWQSVTMGWHHVQGGIFGRPVFAPFPATFIGRVIKKLGGKRIARQIARRYVRSSSVRLIHAHFGVGGIDALPLAKWSGKPLVVTFHGKDVTAQHHNPRIQERYLHQLAEVFEYATTLIAVSDFIAEKLIKMGAPKSKVVVSYLGIPIRNSSMEEPRRDEILFVGRLVEKKGVGDLLSAISILPAKHQNVPVKIVGFGPLSEALKHQALELGVNAAFVGGLSSEEVAAAMSQATIFVAPSKTAENGDAEGFGLVFLEAAAQGLPIVSYAHGGIPEAVEHDGNGILAPEGNIQALSQSIESLLVDADRRRRFGERGRARVREDFCIERRTALLEEIYDEASTSA